MSNVHSSDYEDAVRLPDPIIEFVHPCSD